MAFVDYFIYGSEERQQMRFMKRVMYYSVLYLVSAVMSFSELHFKVSGVITRANAAVVHRPDNPKYAVKIQYDFKDQQGQTHIAKTDIHEDLLEALRAPDGTIEVIYLSGSPDTCELTIERTDRWLVMFGILSAVGAAWIAIIYFNAISKEKSSPRRSSRRR